MLFGIVLYHIRTDPNHPSSYFHWGLALSSDDPSSSWTKPNTNVYDIRKDPSSSSTTPRWKHYGVNIASDPDPSLLGILSIPIVDPSLTLEDLREYIWNGVDPNGRSMIPGPNGWTCAAWCLAAIEGLLEGELIEIEGCGLGEIYDLVQVQGMHLLTMKEAGMVQGPFPVLKLGA